MNDYSFELCLTGTAEPAGYDDDQEANFVFADKIYELFDSDVFLSATGGEWFVSVDCHNQSELAMSIADAIARLEHAGYGVSRIVLDPKQFENQTEISRKAELAGA
ncbi:hypothetical protein FACS189443_1130 [Planctomycetales bacterium]|nr:hypothetical protein FACS189443_1130 [Planctomycetales bacterium]